MNEPSSLKEKLLQLSNSIYTQHKCGTGSVRLLDLAFMLQMELTPAQEAMFTARGSVEFKSTSPEGGTFENKGEVVNLQLPLAMMNVPALVAGKYQSGPNLLRLDFDNGKTLSGKKGFFSAPLERISITENKLHVRIGGPLGGMLTRNVDLA